MSDLKILIVGSCYVDTPLRKQETELWGRLVANRNPGIDVFLLDSCSPFDPRELVPNHIEYWSFPENVGCLTRGGRDGAGRAFCKALDLAIEHGGYDYVVIWETDVMFAPPVRGIIEKMHRTGVGVACCFANPYQFCEFGCAFWNVAFAEESKFSSRYNWEKSPPWPIPEFRIQNMLEDDLFILPMHGWRNGQNQMNIGNISNMFPYRPPAFLTHCVDANLYARWLDLQGIALT